MKIIFKSLSVLFALITFAGFAHAESSKVIGNYVVHYNALSTESLPAKVAQVYGIQRSKNRGLLNISVLKKGGSFEGVEAKIKVVATNLTGQLRTLDVRQVSDQNAVYYISEFSVADRETLDFSIDVTTADNQSANMTLRQQFFAN